MHAFQALHKYIFQVLYMYTFKVLCMSSPNPILKCRHRHHINLLFCGMTNKIDCDHDTDPIVGRISAYKWKNRIACQIRTEIDEAVKAGNHSKELNLQHKIAYCQVLEKDYFFKTWNNFHQMSSH